MRAARILRWSACMTNSCMAISIYARIQYTLWLFGHHSLFSIWILISTLYSLRKAFGVPAGVGRILNADEVMTYRYDPSSRCWKFWVWYLKLMLKIKTIFQKRLKFFTEWFSKLPDDPPLVFPKFCEKGGSSVVKSADRSKDIGKKPLHFEKNGSNRLPWIPL